MKFSEKLELIISALNRRESSSTHTKVSGSGRMIASGPQGRWDDILQTQKPNENLIYPQGIWHYAQAIAQVNKGKLSEAIASFEQLKKISADKTLEEIAIFDINFDCNQWIIIFVSH